MTPAQIYEAAAMTSEQEFENLFNGFSQEEITNFTSLVNLGDSKELALWTVIADRYDALDKEEIYITAYTK